MLSVTLADSIDTSDPCTPGSPSYNPNDPICAQTASIVAQDICNPASPSYDPGNAICVPAGGGEISFDTPLNVRTSCPPGFALQAGVCVPALKAGSAGGSTAAAAALTGFKIPWWMLGLLAVAGGGVAYYAYKHRG